MADNKPTFHHMNNSQSQRIFWLLEELGIEYNLVLHYRNPDDHPKAPFRSPPSLLETGPYGKAPVVVTGAADGNRYIPESSAIATYLIRTFDKQDKFGLQNGDWVRDEILQSINMTGLTRATGYMLYIDLGLIQTALPGFDIGEAKTQLGHLERELKEGPPGGFFMGKEPGRADFMLEFPISFIKHRPWTLNLKDFPLLDEWLQRCHDRPAFKRSLEKGNGYDLGVFPHSGRKL